MFWANVPRTMRTPSEGSAQIKKPQCVIEMPCLDVSLNYAFENTGGGRMSRLIYLGVCEGRLIGGQIGD